MTTGFACWAMAALALSAATPLLPLRPLLERETFWDNRDWDWYEANIPAFECPDADIQTTYYYRWELLTKHLTYGSPNSGYTFTEFIDRPFWSGTYGAISCPAGHQLYEARWLRGPRISRDFARYWFRTPGAQPRNYSTWLADAVWAMHRVHPDTAFVVDLLPDLRRNHAGWEQRHRDSVGLFWQTGHDDGMEYNITSRQTTDPNRGAPGYRPTLNSYLWADALAIARVAELAGDSTTAGEYRRKASELKTNLQQKLWDPKRQFFFPMARRDETTDGFTVKAGSLTYQTGRNAGSEFGRELIGYVPWQFSLPDAGKGYEAAWAKLMTTDGFAASFGPTTVERRDPLFALKDRCCWWSGQSWPYATSQTLKAMANLLQGYRQSVVTPSDYVRLFQTFARTHRKAGLPYLAEACHPDTGSWEGHDAYNHSEHYFHSSFTDLVITGLVGIHPQDDDTLSVRPLAPADWPYFALDQVPYRGHTIAVLWDRDGTRYGRGKGLRLFVDDHEAATSDTLGPLTAKLPTVKAGNTPTTTSVNFAVNNDGRYFPRITASYTAPQTSPTKLVDGNYWYHRDPPNRWTAEGSPNAADNLTLDFGTPRTVHTVKLYFLDDGSGIVPPTRFDLERWDGIAWTSIPSQTRKLEQPAGRRANLVQFPSVSAQKLRAVFHHAARGRSGLTELEAWGDIKLPIEPTPHPAGDLAHNSGDMPFPAATASFSDRFGGIPAKAIDGITNFSPTPLNRWTSYGSPNATDWLEIDFGAEKSFRRIDLAIYDDRGGVRPPKRYDIEVWDGSSWKPVTGVQKRPESPVGGVVNQIRFDRTTASKVRFQFTHAGTARSGVTELQVWDD